jgi:hypothetical protein
MTRRLPSPAPPRILSFSPAKPQLPLASHRLPYGRASSAVSRLMCVRSGKGEEQKEAPLAEKTRVTYCPDKFCRLDFAPPACNSCELLFSLIAHVANCEVRSGTRLASSSFRDRGSRRLQQS